MIEPSPSRFLVLSPPHLGGGFLAPETFPGAAAVIGLSELHGPGDERWSAAGSISVGLLTPENFPAADALLDAGAQALFLYRRPDCAIGQALHDGTGPKEAVRKWREEAEQLLAVVRKHRPRCALVEAERAAAAKADFRFYCQSRLGLNMVPPAAAIEPAPLPSPLFNVIARLLLEVTPNATALACELEASADPIGDTAPDMSLDDGLANLRALLSDRRELLHAEETVKALRSHLHLVQSQIETRFYKARIQSLEAAEKRVVAEKARAEALARELDQLKASASWRVTAPLRAVLRIWRERAVGGVRSAKMAALIRKSSLFDPVWYAEKYKDVAKGRVDPALHYVKFGAAEGRAPGPNFNGAAYLAANPDLARMGVNPLAHYLLHGKTERRPLRPRAGLAPVSPKEA